MTKIQISPLSKRCAFFKIKNTFCISWYSFCGSRSTVYGLCNDPLVCGYFETVFHIYERLKENSLLRAVNICSMVKICVTAIPGVNKLQQMLSLADQLTVLLWLAWVALLFVQITPWIIYLVASVSRDIVNSRRGRTRCEARYRRFESYAGFFLSAPIIRLKLCWWRC